MVNGEYKRILWEIFDVLGLSESEKEIVLEGFKKKFANEMLMEIRDSLSEEHKQWIAETVSKKEYDKNDPKIAETQKAIDAAYPKEKMDETSKVVFKKILTSYTNFVSQKVDPEKSQKLIEIVKNF